MSTADGNLQQARRALEDIDQLKGADTPYVRPLRQVLLWSDLLRMEDRLDSAINMIRLAIQSRSDWFEEVAILRAHLALQLGSAGRLSEAIAEARQALGIALEYSYQERYAEISALLGGLYMISDLPAEAYQMTRVAVETHPLRARFRNLGYRELARHGDSVPLGDQILPICAAASGHGTDALRGLVRLWFDIGRIVEQSKVALVQSSPSSLSAVEYGALHLGVDLACSLQNSTAYNHNELPSLIKKLETGLATSFNEITRLGRDGGDTFDADALDSWRTSRQPDTAYIFLYPTQGSHFLCLIAFSGTTEAIILSQKDGELRELARELWSDARDIGLRGRIIIERLSARLWWPIEAALNENGRPLPKRIAFVPFGWTQLVPLQLLIGTDGDPVFSRYEIYRVPFAADIVARQSSSFRPPGSLRILFVSPFSEELPGAVDEWEIVAQDPGLEVETLGRADCTGKKLVDALTRSRFDIVHFACHAIANYDEPALSYLELWDHRRFYLADILREVICPQATIYLSSCDSAVSGTSDLNLRNSLTEAFHLAGARTVIASQWAAEDAVAVDLAAQFYARLTVGARTAEAFHEGFRAVASGMVSAGFSYRYWGNWIVSEDS